MQVEENFQFNNPDIIIAGVLLGHLVTEDELETQDMSNGRCYA
jgi:hypothetical protein